MSKLPVRILKTLILPVGVYLVFLVISFRRFSNFDMLYTIIVQSIVPTIYAYAIGYNIMSGVFDFTIGSRIIISGVVGGIAAARFGFAGMLIAAMASAYLLAALTGGLYRLLRIPALVLTIGLTMIYEMLGKIIAGSFGFIRLDSKYGFLSKSPYIFIVLIVCAVVFYIFLDRTKFSFHFRAVASNEVVAKNAGINVDAVKFKTFFYGGFFAGVGALLTLSQSGAIGFQSNLASVSSVFKPMMGILLAMVMQSFCNQTIGIFIGQFTLNTIFFGLIAVGMPDTFQNVIVGLFLLVLMFISENSSRIRARRNFMKAAKSHAEQIVSG